MSVPAEGGRRRLTPEEIQTRHQQDPLLRSRAQHQDATTDETQDDTLSTDPPGTVGYSPLVRQPEFHATAQPPAAPILNRDGRNSTSTDRLHTQPDGNPTVASPAKVPTDGTDNMWVATSPGHVDPRNRAAFLAGVQPEGRRSDIDAVKAQVIELVLGTDATTETSLRSLMSVLCRFAIWCRNNTADGTFNPARDLNEDQLHAFKIDALAHLERGSQATYMSVLRRVNTSIPKARPVGRNPASAPYSARSADLYWTTALEMDEWIFEEMRTLLSLTFGTGAMSDEIATMRADQVIARASRTTLQITRRHELREVPVYGAYGTRLKARSAQLKPTDYLLRPTFHTRKNVVSDTVKRAAKRSSVFEGFKALRARHTWVCRCLLAGIPPNVLNVAAGVGPDNNLFSDLTAHMPTPTQAEVRRAFDRARNHPDDITPDIGADISADIAHAHPLES